MVVFSTLCRLRLFGMTDVFIVVFVQPLSKPAVGATIEVATSSSETSYSMSWGKNMDIQLQYAK